MPPRCFCNRISLRAQPTKLPRSTRSPTPKSRYHADAASNPCESEPTVRTSEARAVSPVWAHGLYAVDRSTTQTSPQPHPPAHPLSLARETLAWSTIVSPCFCQGFPSSPSDAIRGPRHLRAAFTAFPRRTTMSTAPGVPSTIQRRGHHRCPFRPPSARTLGKRGVLRAGDAFSTFLRPSRSTRLGLGKLEDRRRRFEASGRAAPSQRLG